MGWYSYWDHMRGNTEVEQQVARRLWRRAAYQLGSYVARVFLWEQFHERVRTVTFRPELGVMRMIDRRFREQARTVLMCLVRENREVACTYDVVMEILERLSCTR